MSIPGFNSLVDEIGEGIPSTETIRSSFLSEIKMFRDDNPTMNGCVAKRNNTPSCIIKTNDNKNFRIYFASSTFFNSRLVNRLCRFIHSRTSDQTITFILGTKMFDGQVPAIGSVLSTMMECSAKIVTIAAGYCSIPETMIWCYGVEREVYRYGALLFGKTDIVRHCEAYNSYFSTYLERAVSIGVLSSEEKEEIMTSGTEKMIMYHEYQAKMK